MILTVLDERGVAKLVPVSDWLRAKRKPYKLGSCLTRQQTSGSSRTVITVTQLSLPALTMCKYVKYCICMAVFYLLLTDGARGNPVNTDSNCLDEIVRDHEQMRHVNKVLHSMGKVLEDNLYILYNKLISLSQVSDLIVQQGQNAQIIQGTADEMSVRCPKGFQAVAGDRTCYQ